ncbi:MAG: hypothetical protein ACO3ZG_02285 [Kiritimatiellia bacterium]
MTSKMSIKLLVATMLLGWLPEQMTICLASMTECEACCCSCCPDEGNSANTKQSNDDNTCCITLNIEPADQAASVKIEAGIKHTLVLVDQLAHDNVGHTSGYVFYTCDKAQAPPGPPLRLTLCTLLI